MRIRNDETICAISTPHGVGGIAIIRVSGLSALEFSQKIIPKLKKVKIETHKVYFVDVFDFSNQKVDEVLATYFAKGKSFTGDEVIEVSCHGSVYISQKILDLFIEAGCKLAERGEFTFRAFMNNRIDLIQAESVLSVIQSQSELSSKVALRQLSGAISKSFDLQESDLTWCLAHIEASIDFSTEGLDVVDIEVLKKKLVAINMQLKDIISSYNSGKILKDGLKVVLIGKPNVGKSSLLNILVQDEKAIVTEVAGTTRDVIESETSFAGVRFVISDTAGLRETTDRVELMGVNRSRAEATKADVLCCVLSFDNQEEWSESFDVIRKSEVTHKILILTKSDLVDSLVATSMREKLQPTLKELGIKDTVSTSHIDSLSRNRVLTTIKDTVGDLSFLDQAIISSSRQLEGAKYSSEMIEKSLVDLESGVGAEFVAMHLKEALVSLQKILGRVYDDQILDRVFKEFCLGK
jgi:tRNA modification GTPase